MAAESLNTDENCLLLLKVCACKLQMTYKWQHTYVQHYPYMISFNHLFDICSMYEYQAKFTQADWCLYLQAVHFMWFLIALVVVLTVLRQNKPSWSRRDKTFNGICCVTKRWLSHVYCNWLKQTSDEAEIRHWWDNARTWWGSFFYHTLLYSNLTLCCCAVGLHHCLNPLQQHFMP